MVKSGKKEETKLWNDNLDWGIIRYANAQIIMHRHDSLKLHAH